MLNYVIILVVGKGICMKFDLLKVMYKVFGIIMFEYVFCSV